MPNDDAHLLTHTQKSNVCVSLFEIIFLYDQEYSVWFERKKTQPRGMGEPASEREAYN